jgi:hypothetical protein
MLDFDNIDDWASKLTAALRPYVPNYVEQKLVEAVPEYMYIEDVQDKLFDLTDRDAIIDAVVDWLRSKNIAGYHGSRLTDAEFYSVKVTGLIPLEAETRRNRLISALSPYPRWPEVVDQLDGAIQAHGQGSRAGHREGQVHLTLSRAGLTQDFNHYLIYGSEFDQHVVQELLGTEGMELLASYGEPRVFLVAVPGALALDAANRSITVDDFRARGEIPNLVREFLKSWACRLAYPSFQSQTLKVDCGMVFHRIIPAAWITGFDTLSDIYNRDTLSTNDV